MVQLHTSKATDSPEIVAETPEVKGDPFHTKNLTTFYFFNFNKTGP